MKTNMNTIAREVTLIEGKKVQLSIAQIKEVLRCLKLVCEDPKALKTTLNYLEPRITVVGFSVESLNDKKSKTVSRRK